VDVDVIPVESPSRTEQDEVVQEISSALGRLIDVTFGVKYDVSERAIIVTVYSDAADFSTTEREEIERVASGPADSLAVDVIVQLVESDAPVFRSSTQGGENYHTNCTGGFMGYRNGAYGIITAKHCNNLPT